MAYVIGHPETPKHHPTNGPDSPPRGAAACIPLISEDRAKKLLDQSTAGVATEQAEVEKIVADFRATHGLNGSQKNLDPSPGGTDPEFEEIVTKVREFFDKNGIPYQKDDRER